MTAEIRLASWNLNWMSRSDEAIRRKIAYLETRPWDIVALQEVVPEFIDVLRESGITSDVAYPSGTRHDRFASALVARNEFSLRRPCLIAGLPDPRRGIAAMAVRDGIEFECLSWHAPNAARRENRSVKRAGYLAFIDWVERRRGPLLVGTDANHGSFYVREEDFPGSPFKTDFPRDEWFEENEWWTRSPAVLQDTWITYLAERPDVLQEVRVTWAGGPSAVSYTRGKTPDRFDYVLASDEFSVLEVAYDYEGSRAACSDHGLVSALVRLD